MKCRDLESLSVEYLSNRLHDEKRRTVDAHLSACASCRRTIELAQKAWSRLDGLPLADPGSGLRTRWKALLAAEKRNARMNPAIPAKAWRPAFGFALSLAFIAVGFIAGFLLRGILFGTGDVSALRSEVSDMRAMLTVSLLDRPSSADRLFGVQVSKRVSKPDSSVLNALFNALNQDPSTGVRLATVDALYLFRDRAGVREALIRSLERQSSAIVQVQIIDLLVEIRDRKALDALRLLIQNGATHPSVREHAEWGIQKLI